MSQILKKTMAPFCAPAIFSETLGVQGAMANPDHDCSEYEFQVMEQLAKLYAIAMQHRRTGQELHRYRHRLEEMVEERTAELSAAKEQAEAALIAAEEANRSKGEFLARMSHEMRTPLNAIIGLTNIVLKSKLTGGQRDYLNKVRIASDSLSTIINDILDFSKVEAGRLDMEHAPFDLGQVMDHLADLFSNQIADNNLELIFDVNPNVPRRLTGDGARLAQVLINLIQNAIKFTESGRIVVGVALDDTAPKGQSQAALIFRVSDTGEGIAADALPALFEPFVQGEGYLTRKHEGTGLGLAICRQLVELMGGRLWAQSTPGQGSTFYFTVMLESQKEPPEAVAPQPAQKQAAPPIQCLIGRRVLVVEDNELNRDLVVALLEEKGLLVETSENGRIAVDKVIESPKRFFDAVLMDLQMPLMDGYEATRHIRAWEAQAQGAVRRSPSADRRIPIIALTAHALIGEKEKCLAAEMQDYLPKPLDVQDLYRVLLKWIAPQEAEKMPFMDGR